MTISALQLKNATAKAAAGEVTGMGATVTLYATGFSDVPLTVSALAINRGDTDYSTVSVPADAETLSAILAISATARIKLYLLLFTGDGKSYVGSNLDLDISDFRYDRGVDSITVALVSRSPINIPASAQSEVLDFQSKRKLGAPSNTTVYSVNPFNYLKYSLGSTVTDGADTGTVVSAKLSLSPKGAPSLFIEVQPV